MADRPYIPLVAGMELVRRSGPLTVFPVGNMLGNLPQMPYDLGGEGSGAGAWVCDTPDGPRPAADPGVACGIGPNGNIIPNRLYYKISTGSGERKVIVPPGLGSKQLFDGARLSMDFDPQTTMSGVWCQEAYYYCSYPSTTLYGSVTPDLFASGDLPAVIAAYSTVSCSWCSICPGESELTCSPSNGDNFVWLLRPVGMSMTRNPHLITAGGTQMFASELVENSWSVPGQVLYRYWFNRVPSTPVYATQMNGAILDIEFTPPP